MYYPNKKSHLWKSWASCSSLVSFVHVFWDLLFFFIDNTGYFLISAVPVKHGDEVFISESAELRDSNKFEQPIFGSSYGRDSGYVGGG
jgi:hypothetical protein